MTYKEVKEEMIEFPDNRIVLLDGSELECYPTIIRPDHVNDNKLAIDLSGEYLSVKGKPKEKKMEPVDQREYFLKNAFLFFRNAHRIFSDSRMFLAPVPSQSGLAYIGSSGFSNPTLGVYLEWWLNCKVDVTKDEEGKEALTYQIAGSPLSGMNKCRRVYPDGTTAGISYSSFPPLWGLFMKINERYSEAKSMYEAYTMEEVVNILSAMDQGREAELEARLHAGEAHRDNMRIEYNELENKFEYLQSRCIELSLLLHKNELDAFRSEYYKRKNETDTEIESLSCTQSQYKAQMRQGLINQVEYQRTIAPLLERKKQLNNELAQFREEQIKALVATGHLTRVLVEQYLL